MKFFKFILALTVASIFAIACNNTATNNANQTANTNTAPPQITPSASQPTATPDEFVTIRATYSATCIRCHKANGEGGTVELDEGKPLKVPTFKEGHALKHTDQEFARQIANGGEGMPAFKTRLTPEQINQLVRFIRKEFQGQTTTTTPPASANTAPPAHK